MSFAASKLDVSLIESLIEALPDGCLVVDHSGHILSANRRWRELPRQTAAIRSAHNPIGLNYLELYRFSIPSERLDQAVAGIKTVLDGTVEEFEHDYIRVDAEGNFLWFRMIVRAWPQLGAGAIITHRDISAEKLPQVDSERVQQEFRVLADSAPVLIWMSGIDRGCSFFNRRWLDFTGVPLEDQIGEGALQIVHPDDRDRIFSTYHRAFDQGEEFEYEYRLRYKDGSYRSIRDHGSPHFDAQNRMIGYIGSAWDLSDQKKAADDAYRATRYAHLIRDVAVIANTATTLRGALQRSIDVICETMKFPVGHALLIKDDEPELAKPSHVVHVDDMERFKKLFALSNSLTWPAAKGSPGEVLRSGKPVVHDVIEDCKTPDRYPRALACLEAGLRTSLLFPIVVEEKVEAILEFASEEVMISDQDAIDSLIAASERLARFFERRRAQLRFFKQKKDLEDSADRLFSMAGRLVDSQEEERRRIAREIHDDFTQRLAVVSMRIGSLTGSGRTSTPAELDAGLEAIRDATTGLANDLRDLSRHLHPAMLELLGFTSAMEALCEEFERAKGIQITFASSVHDNDASTQVATCLYRVLQESLMNIAKHADSNSADVSLSRQKNHLQMRIRDEGKGFDLETVERRGLGLVNMEERVQFLLGTFSLKSKLGAGTEIVVRIPAKAMP